MISADFQSAKDSTTTSYVRDAQGNVLSTYTHGSGPNTQEVYQDEVHLYGSSRLGTHRVALATLAAYNSTEPSVTVGTFKGLKRSFTRGNKFFELSNHLGNVLAVVSDRKVPVASANPALVARYTPVVVQAQDYYAFGMIMPGKKYTASSSSYRYGFNGKENDNEVKGEGNQQDYGMRIYDNRLGRFLSVDPIGKKFPYYTPYQFAGNKPIWCIDLDGLEDIPTTALNRFGEKQVYLITSTTEYGSAGPLSISSEKVIPSHAQPATKGMTDAQVYQLAFSRFAMPGKILIKSNQYIDERLMKAEQQVEYFFTHNFPAYSSSTAATNIAHAYTAVGLLNGDEAAIKQV